MYTGVQHNFHIRWCSCHSRVTLQVSRLKQELLTLLEPLSSSPVFSGVCVAQSIVFFCPFGHCIVCPYFFDLRHVITTFGLFKLFLMAFYYFYKICYIISYVDQIYIHVSERN